MELSQEPSHDRRPLLIADWEVLPDRHVVRRDGHEHALEPRLMQVLVHLASRPGEVVPRAELLRLVWGGTVVQEEALTQAVSRLRSILGDSSRESAIIETVPKSGYRMVATVAPLSVVDGPDAATTPGPRRWPWVAAAAAVLGALLVMSLTRRDAPPVGLLDTEPVTTLPGDEIQPAMSPDGMFVVFTWRPEGADDFKLHRKRTGSEERVALTDEPGREFSPCWSPDGERIAFARSRDGERRVCVVAAIGGPVQELGPPHWLMGGLDWSPDGQTIAYSWKDEQEAPMRLMRLRVADGKADTLTFPENLSRGDTYPRFSPDGTRLALVRSDRGISRHVAMMPAAGGDVTRLTDGFFSCGGLDWAPDGESLVLSATPRGTFELWRVAADDGAMTLLPTRIHRSMHPSWAADGTLVFTDNTLDMDLLTGDLGEPAFRETVARSTRLDMGGRISPDGGTIVFISDRGGSRELWLLDRSDGSVRPLTTFAGDALRKPLWSPDGRWIAVNVGRGGLLQVVVIDVASGLQRQVTPDTGHHRLGHWSADGAHVFYSREDGPEWRIAKVRLDGAGAEDVPAPGCLSLREQPDGGLLYFKETEDGLFRRPRAGGEETVVAPAALQELNNIQLAVDGYWFTRSVDGVPHLSFHEFASGVVSDRAVLGGDPTGVFHLAPDGRRFVYDSVARTSNDLVMVRGLRRAEVR
jgi:Tol biopolymer transport system component/DNA-binding winged helix-turn-helix (wHTH) protein